MHEIDPLFLQALSYLYVGVPIPELPPPAAVSGVDGTENVVFQVSDFKPRSPGNPSPGQKDSDDMTGIPIHVMDEINAQSAESKPNAKPQGPTRKDFVAAARQLQMEGLNVDVPVNLEEEQTAAVEEVHEVLQTERLAEGILEQVFGK